MKIQHHHYVWSLYDDIPKYVRGYYGSTRMGWLVKEHSHAKFHNTLRVESLESKLLKELFNEELYV